MSRLRLTRKIADLQCILLSFLVEAFLLKLLFVGNQALWEAYKLFYTLMDRNH